ncbi:hypothetical protein B0H11DRAFT_1724657, partial [Mycena galericulata]
MFFELLSSSDSATAGATWTNDLAQLTIGRVDAVGQAIPEMIVHTQIYDLMTRAVQAEICRSLVGVYQWIVHLGPSLAEHLIHIRLEEADGSSRLAEAFPQFAKLVEHVISFVEAEQEKRRARQPEAKSKKRGNARKRRKTQCAPETPLLPDADASDPIAADSSNMVPKIVPNFSRLPADLFGLLPNRKGTVAIPPLPSKSRMKLDKDGLYTVSVTWLCLIWDEHLVLRKMEKIDSYINRSERVKD